MGLDGNYFNIIIIIQSLLDERYYIIIKISICYIQKDDIYSSTNLLIAKYSKNYKYLNFIIIFLMMIKFKYIKFL